MMKKRPDRKLYIPPSLRSKVGSEGEDSDIQDIRQQVNSDIQDIRQQVNSDICYYKGEHDCSRSSSTDISQWRMRCDCSSTSSGTKQTDESCKDDDSSDFEDSFFVPINHIEINKQAVESCNDWEECCNDHSEEAERKFTDNDDSMELKIHQTNTAISDIILKEYEDHSGLLSDQNDCLISDSKETKLNQELFYNYDDSSISDIEAIIDAHTTKGRVLTSTPISDIDDENVLEAAKYVPTEESITESTLLDQNDIYETVINTNTNERGHNFEIFYNSPSVKNKTKDEADIISGTYIPPPVPTPPNAAHLPIISRLPIPALSSYRLCGSGDISPQKVFHQSIQQRYPQHAPPLPHRPYPNIQQRISNPSYNSSNIYLSPRRVLPQSMQPESLGSLHVPRIPSPTPPPLLLQKRSNLLHFSQNEFYRISNPSTYSSTNIYTSPRRVLPQSMQPQHLGFVHVPRIPPPTPPTLLLQKRFNLPHSSQGEFRRIFNPSCNSSKTYLSPRRILPQHAQLEFFGSLHVPRIPPPTPPPLLLQKRANLPHSSQNEFHRISNPSTCSSTTIYTSSRRVLSQSTQPESIGSLHIPSIPSPKPSPLLHQRSFKLSHSSQNEFLPPDFSEQNPNSLNLGTFRNFVIPPPKPVPRLDAGRQQINIIRQHENGHSHVALPNSHINNVEFDGKLQL